MRHLSKPLILFLMLVLGACYLPSELKAEVRIARDGQFQITYIGDLADSDLISRRTDPDEIEEKIAVRQRDLARDSGFTQIRYKGEGYFEVTYDKRGNIFRQRTITFVNSGSKIVTIALVARDNKITIRGGSIPANFHDQLRATGYDLRGQFTVVTDANVTDHNAQSVTGEETRTYSWTLAGLEAVAPKLVIDTGSAE